MAKISHTEDELSGPNIPDGIHPAIIEKCEQRPMKNNPADQEFLFQFLIKGDDNPSINGERVFHSCPDTKGGMGWKLAKVIEGLGTTVAEFDSDDYNGTGVEVYIETKTSISKGNTYINVADVRKR